MASLEAERVKLEQQAQEKRAVAEAAMENKRKAEQELIEAESEQNRLNNELTTAANAIYEAGPS
jgi:hypothetical protein